MSDQPSTSTGTADSPAVDEPTPPPAPYVPPSGMHEVPAEAWHERPTGEQATAAGEQHAPTTFQPFATPSTAVAPALVRPQVAPAVVEPDLPDLRPGEYVLHDGGQPYMVVARFDDVFTDDNGRTTPGYVLGPADLFTHPQPRSVLYTEDEWRDPAPRTPVGK